MAFDWPDDYTVEKRIGIGKEIPLQALDVIGNISATGDISATNLNLNGSLNINQNLTAGGNFQLGTLSVNEFSSDGNLADNSNLAVPTERAVKTYVDNRLDTKAALNGAADENFATNDLSVGGNLQVSGDLEVQGNVIARDTEHIEGNVSLGDEDSDLITITGVVSSGHSSGALEVNSGLHTTGSVSVDGSLTVSNAIIASGNFQLGTLSINEFSSDGNLTDNSDLAIPTEQAVKTYVDNQITQVNNSLDTKAVLNGDSNQDFAANNLTVSGDLEVKGNVIARDTEHIEGNTSLGDEDSDLITITGVVSSGHSSGALEVNSGLHTTGSVSVDESLTVSSSLTTQEVNASETVGIGIATPETPLHIESKKANQGLKIGARDKNTKIQLHIAGGDYGFLGLGGETKLRGNGQESTFSGNLNVDGNITGKNFNLIGGSNDILLTRKVLSSPGPFGTIDDSKNYLKLSLSKRQVYNEAPPNYKFWIGHPGIGYFGNKVFFSRFALNSDGDARIARTLSVGRDLSVGGHLTCHTLKIRSKEKSGYVSDHFVNAVGDPIEQGDVVVLSDHPVSKFCATHNDVPIPEVDLTNQAYDTRVCGIVAKVTTEDDLPYVEKETSEIPPEILEQLPPEALQGQVPLEELSEEISASLQAPHPYQSLAAQTEKVMNTTVVQDQQMGSMVTMGCFSYCKVDADIAAIAVGDLLTTSPTKGHGQKVLEPERAIGAIIGKALSSLNSGKGIIPVLVMLQ